MSAVDQLSIGLEHDIDEQYQYQPSEVVRGHIYMLIVRPTFIRTIYITIVGQGSVGWDDESTGETIQAEESYINASKYVIDARQGKPLSLKKGRHEFSFEYQLPENLPSSYIGKFGSVTYLLKGTVQGDKANDHAITSEPFLVLRRSPLPSFIEQPMVLQTEKRLWRSCTFGKISLKASLNKQGGVPGEDLFVHAEVKNKSKRTITAVQAAIVMNSSYHAKNYSTVFRQIVNKKRDEYDLTYNEGRRWSYVRLTVPPYIPESNLEFCDIIEIEYSFQFRVELSGGVEIKLEEPLLIGGQPAGLEIPHSENEREKNKRNSQWTIRTKGMVFEGDNVDNKEEQHGFGDWHQGVPELRQDKAVVNNPLFRHGSFLKQGGSMNNIPEEQIETIENTRL